MYNLKLWAAGIFLCFALGTCLNATVINVDLEGLESNTDTHVGSDGIWSTGGTVWTSVYAQGYLIYSQTMDPSYYYEDSPDEFGNSTPVDMYTSSNSYGVDEPMPNNLQDSGLSSEFLYIVDLLPNQTYDLAVYLGTNAYFHVNDLNGSHSSGDIVLGNTPTGILPGTQNVDYIVFHDLEPFDTGDGIYGIYFDTFDGQITGMQIKGVVPEPASLSLLLLGSLTAIRKRRAFR